MFPSRGCFGKLGKSYWSNAINLNLWREKKNPTKISWQKTSIMLLWYPAPVQMGPAVNQSILKDATSCSNVLSLNKSPWWPATEVMAHSVKAELRPCACQWRTRCPRWSGWAPARWEGTCCADGLQMFLLSRILTCTPAPGAFYNPSVQCACDRCHRSSIWSQCFAPVGCSTTGRELLVCLSPAAPLWCTEVLCEQCCLLCAGLWSSPCFSARVQLWGCTNLGLH